MDLLRAWFRRTFSDPQVVILGMFLLFFFAVVIWLGAYLAPDFLPGGPYPATSAACRGTPWSWDTR